MTIFAVGNVAFYCVYALIVYFWWVTRLPVVAPSPPCPRRACHCRVQYTHTSTSFSCQHLLSGCVWGRGHP